MDLQRILDEHLKWLLSCGVGIEEAMQKMDDIFSWWKAMHTDALSSEDILDIVELNKIYALRDKR